MTTAKYLDTLARDGLLIKQKIKRTNYYINQPLYDILTRDLPADD